MLYHGTDIFSAEKIINIGIDIYIGRPYLDFGQGFYTTPSLTQAQVWAKGTDSPCVIAMDFDETGLRIKGFSKPDRDWAEFVVKNRLQLIKTTDYDCIYGPMADAGVSRMRKLYRDHKLSIEQAIKRVGANPNGWQWVMLNERAVKNIKNIRKVER